MNLNELKHFTIDKYDDNKKILIYGAAIGGEIAYSILQQYKIPVWNICDRTRVGTKICGKTVVSPEKVLQEDNLQILVTATRGFNSIMCMLKNYSGIDIYEITSLLSESKLSYKGISYNASAIEDFLNKYRLYAFEYNNDRNICLPTFDIVVSETCTLRCKDCSALVPFLKQRNIYKAQDIISDFDTIYSLIDEIQELVIVGGEPFIYQELPQLLNYFNRLEKIDKITVVTNGTIVPNSNMIDKLKENKVRIRLSEYGIDKQILPQLIELFKKEKIKYYVQKLDYWLDLGFPTKHNYSTQQIERIFQDCAFSKSQGLLNGKIFRCMHAAEIFNMLNIEMSEGLDYLELRNEDITKDKLIHYLYYIKSINICEYCNGAMGNVKGIKPGIQCSD